MQYYKLFILRNNEKKQTKIIAEFSMLSNDPSVEIFRRDDSTRQTMFKKNSLEYREKLSLSKFDNESQVSASFVTFSDIVEVFQISDRSEGVMNEKLETLHRNATKIPAQDSAVNTSLFNSFSFKCFGGRDRNKNNNDNIDNCIDALTNKIFQFSYGR